jgi:hypothetical protein
MDGETEREKDMHFSNAYNDEDDELVLCKGQMVSVPISFSVERRILT